MTPCLGPAGVEGRTGQDLGDFLLGHAVLLRALQMVPEGRIRQSLRHQRRHRHDGAVAQGEPVLPAPDLSKEYIVVQLREFRGEYPDSSRFTNALFTNSHGPRDASGSGGFSGTASEKTAAGSGRIEGAGALFFFSV